MNRKTGALLALAGIFLPFIDIVNTDHLINRQYYFSIAGVLLIMAGVFIIYRSSRNQGFRVPDSRMITGKVLGVTRGLRASEKEEETFYIIAEGDDGKGNIRQFNSLPLRKYPGKQVIGQPVTIRFGSGDPEDYSLDLSQIGISEDIIIRQQ